MASSASPAAFAPFREPLFRTLWLAAFVSNVGTWMQNVGVSWLAATLSASPLLIALIQTAAALPALLLSYPAGVVADQTDRRRLLIGVQAALGAVVALLAVLTGLHLLSLPLLLGFVFLVGVGAAFTTPVWQAVTPEVISPAHLREAVALNGVNFNLARAVGPALGGVLLTVAGAQALFWFNAASFLVLLLALYRWHNTPAPPARLHFRAPALAGLRAVATDQAFRRLLLRTASFTGFSSVVFALLPQLSRYHWHQSSGQYTWLWVCLGLGAMLGSYVYGRCARALTPSRHILLSCLLVAASLLGLSWSADFSYLNAVMLAAGVGWINATSALNVLAQQYAPPAYRGRFLALNAVVFQGSIALASLLWGFLATTFSPLLTLQLAAGGMVLASVGLAYWPLPATPSAPTAVPCLEPLRQYHVLPAAPQQAAPMTRQPV
jgi:MFS family permease